MNFPIKILQLLQSDFLVRFSGKRLKEPPKIGAHGSSLVQQFGPGLGAWFLFNVVSWILRVIFWSFPVIGPFLAGLWLFASALVHLGLLVIMIIAMVKAFTGARWDIPFVGPIARKQMGETPL